MLLVIMLGKNGEEIVMYREVILDYFGFRKMMKVEWPEYGRPPRLITVRLMPPISSYDVRLSDKGQEAVNDTISFKDVTFELSYCDYANTPTYYAKDF